MRLFFCEKCGKRLDDRDLDSGAARDKKLKGVYCAECSVGVNTMAMQPISDADLHRADPAKPASDVNPRRAIPHVPHAPGTPVIRRRLAAHGAQARPEFETKKGASSGVAAILVGAGVLAFALLFLFRPSSSAPGKTASASSDERKPESAAKNDAQPESAVVSRPPAPPPVATKLPVVQKTAERAPAMPPPKTEPANPALEKERAAQAAFDKILAESDPKKDKAQAVERMQAFVDAYPESVVGARGRSLLAEWNRPDAPPAEKSDVAAAVPAAKTAGEAPAPEPAVARPSAPGGAWETLHESQFTGPDLDPFWRADGNADARFAGGAWHVDTSRPINGKYLLSASGVRLDRAYRLTVVAGYRGDAPKQQLLVACFRSGNARFTAHGMQNRTPMVVVSLSANTLSFLRMHQQKAWSREDLMKDEALKEGEHTIVFEIGPETTSLAVDGKERFNGAHGLKNVEEVKFQLLGTADTFPRGEEVWFRSAKLESARPAGK